VKVISVILGSDSDRDVYSDAEDMLNNFQIQFEKRIISAHRTPDILKEYVMDAEKRGVRVFITIAGMSAALPGVVASFTTRPVIGVPVAGKSPLFGLDSLFSIVQMPPGVPVATVSVNGGKNAALLAAEILALNDGDLAKELQSFREEQKNKTIQKDQQFQSNT
jgi:5-(carboxyamino)imidazole ribonucleotide mutase